jgi:hypothetical protein
MGPEEDYEEIWQEPHWRKVLKAIEDNCEPTLIAQLLTYAFYADFRHLADTGEWDCCVQLIRDFHYHYGAELRKPQPTLFRFGASDDFKQSGEKRLQQNPEFDLLEFLFIRSQQRLENIDQRYLNVTEDRAIQELATNLVEHLARKNLERAFPQAAQKRSVNVPAEVLDNRLTEALKELRLDRIIYDFLNCSEKGNRIHAPRFARKKLEDILQNSLL